jgi:hypothetical protein
VCYPHCGEPYAERNAAKLEKEMTWKQEAIGMDAYLVLCVSSGRAQTSGNSSLSGVVSDPTGAVVPDAITDQQSV